MRINVHAGHNPADMIACGAVGILNESTENRNVKDLVISKLQALGHTVFDCTVDNGTSQPDVLNKIVAKCNANSVDLDVSIHFNAGGGNGTEVWVYPNGNAEGYANRICEAIADLGFRNRGVKSTTSLYVLSKTKAPALLVECCFVDSENDANLYNAESMANAIVKGITGETISISSPTPEPTVTTSIYYPRYTGNTTSISNALNSIGVDGSFANRSRIASANGIVGYSGTASQNIQLLSLLKQGMLVKAGSVQEPSSIYFPRYTGGSGSIVEALKAIGVDSSFKNRSRIAKANGIGLYVGTASQNSKMVSLLKQGKLIEA